MRNKDFEIVRQYLYDNFDIQNIVYLLYQGVFTGSEFETYASTKLYLCHSLEFGYGSPSANVGSITLYDENNVIMYRANNNEYYYDTSVPSYRNAPNTMVLKNIYFSRVTRSVYGDFRFIGYRITIP